MKRLALASITLLGLAAPALAQNQNPLPPIQAQSTAKVNIVSATTTEIVAAANYSGQTGGVNLGKAIYVVGGLLVAGGSGNVTFEYGTKVSTACDTGATAISGPIPVSAGTVLPLNGNLGPSIVVLPAAGIGQELCIVTSSSATLYGWLAVAQF